MYYYWLSFIIWLVLHPFCHPWVFCLHLFMSCFCNLGNVGIDRHTTHSKIAPHLEWGFFWKLVLHFIYEWIEKPRGIWMICSLFVLSDKANIVADFFLYFHAICGNQPPNGFQILHVCYHPLQWCRSQCCSHCLAALQLSPLLSCMKWQSER